MASFNIPFLSDIFGKPKTKPSRTAGDGSVLRTPVDLDKIYTLKPENWFTNKPYGFTFFPKSGNSSGLTMFLPISPSNLTITTNFATNVIPTLYGTVEEHSPIRYYDITIEGNTSMSPRYVEVGQEIPYKGRASAEIVDSLSGKAGGFFSETLGLLDKVKNAASSLSQGQKEESSGIDMLNTGYVAFHNLYRLLHKYKSDVSGEDNVSVPRKRHPLTFFNYKDNNEYDVVVRGFTLIRSADDPMMYRYQISLRGYNMRVASGTKNLDSTEQRLKDLGLDGVDSSSFLAKVKGTASKVKGILGPIGAGINRLGR